MGIQAGCAISILIVAAAYSQTAVLRPAPQVQIPFRVDGNSPSVWHEGKLLFFTSDGRPVVAKGDDLFDLTAPSPVTLDNAAHVPVWIEAAWRDEDGTIYAWYHNEPAGVCPGGKLTAPRIGAARSIDGGYSFTDLGLILTSGDPFDCRSQNGFFAGGHGDFSVIPDENREDFYVYFTNYGGPLEGQGVSVARMAFADRDSPAGAVYKYHQGDWSEAGLGGRMTAVFRARTTWQASNNESFWGPAVHWNTHLRKYVVVMNHTCCGFEWPQEGIYISYNADLSQPWAWTPPQQLIDEVPWRPGFYPQVIGIAYGETDTVVGQTARFFLHGRSQWEIVFHRPEEMEPMPLPDPEPPQGVELPPIDQREGVPAWALRL